MEVWDHCVIYTADDEEPNYGRCDSCDSNFDNAKYWFEGGGRELTENGGL